jgi:tyrosine-protein kinase Etk/Wzc
MTDANAAAPRSQRVIDEATGQPIQLIYALPADLFAGDPGDRGDQGIGIGHVLGRLWRRRFGMAAIVAAAAAISVFLSLTARPIWTTTVRAIPPAAKSGGASLGQYADIASLAGISLPGAGGSSVDEIMAILGSRTLHQRLIERFDLAKHYRSELLQDAQAAFARDFSAALDKKANTITYSFRTYIGTPEIPDQAKLAEVLNQASSELQAIFNRIHQSASRREREFLEGRSARIQEDYAHAQLALAEFQREHRTMQLESQVKATVEAVSALEGQMIGQQVELRALLASQASADNPSVHLLKERINALDDTIKRLTGSNTPGDDGDVLLRLGSLPQLGIEYVNLLREVKKNEAILQALTAQTEAARFNELRSAEVITIIDPAIAPERRTSPKRSQMCMLGLMLGTMVAIGWAIAADQFAAWRVAIRAAAAPVYGARG